MPKINNFDLIRLLAAVQVACMHSANHLKVEELQTIFSYTRLLPGVPIFFFISGFLISKSFENNPDIRNYALNRILRIYPALVVCFFVSYASVLMSGYFRSKDTGVFEVLIWAISQLTFVQFYGPDFLRDYGVGVLNGSLWTIVVELQFYLLVPIIYVAFRRFHLTHTNINWALLVGIACFAVANQAYHSFSDLYPKLVVTKLVGVSFTPWFYMFLLGVLFQRNYALCYRLFGERLGLITICYLVSAYSADKYLHWSLGNAINPILYPGLAIFIFAAAFSHTSLSEQLLKRNDISYGVYIFHMPIVNLLIATGFQSNVWTWGIAMGGTLVAGYLSWRMVEQPALRLKRRSSYTHQAVR